MKNRINPQITTKRNINNSQNKRLLSQNKSPIALFIATALFAFGSTHVIAAPEDIYAPPTTPKNIYTYTGREIGTDDKPEQLDLDNETAYNSLIRNGQLNVFNGSEAIGTTVLDKGNLSLSGNGSKASNTTIERGGFLVLSPRVSAHKTIVKSGGTISIDQAYGDLGNPAILNGTTIEGILSARNTFILEGDTDFLTGSKLEIDDPLDDEFSFTNNGTLIFSNSMEINSGIKGNGQLIIRENLLNRPEKLKLILIGRNINDPDDADYDYSGETLLENGIFQIKKATFHNSKIMGIGQEKTELWIGDADSDEKSYLRTTVQGTHVSIFGASRWDMTGNSTIDNLNLSSLGSINLSYDNKPGNILTINGDYDANSQSLLVFNTQLGDDDSPTDRMIVEGNTSGETNVEVNNVGGAGNKTDLGILLIKVLGRSDGEFKQSGRIVAGAYEYKLGRGKGALNKNWYIRSDTEDFIAGNTKPTDAEPTLTQSETQDNAEPVEAAVLPPAPAAPSAPTPPPASAAPSAPTPPPAPVAPSAPTPPPAPTAPSAPAILPSQPQVYAPENGSYIANIVMARNLFNTRLDDRSGTYQYKDAVSGQWRTSSMWMHTQGGRNNFGHAVDQLDIKGKYYSVQLGMDVIQEGSGRIGVLAGLGKATNHSQSKVTSYYSNGSVSGYNLGVYATWLPEQKDNTGFYIDTLAQYSWFNNVVHGQEQAEDKYKSSGFTTSIESGYTFRMATTDQLSYFIQPNAQITLQGIQAQTHKTAYDELISDGNKGHMVTRIGAKTYLQTINSSDSQFTPFISVNWLRQNQNTGTIISGQRIESRSKSSTEFKIGLESQIEQQLHIWATIDYQVGRYNDKNTNALAGIKYHF
ncbi:autotransporter outer membrane beta-barrel domain-containing protein [Yersinia mollaretii]|uniref:autotransporter outer membrane beta-barrel domain-containing protein n=1 Tax=Yersinia mollaretii TaxID=33060 RepID=UPI0011A337A4|nr:autotransporter outer membrane beta-barrel domain-containing protein [Yersinia mollaretii]